MSECIKTGAVVHFVEWRTNVPCDLHKVNDTIIIHFNPQHFYGCGRKPTHGVYVGIAGYINKNVGIAVVPERCLTTCLTTKENVAENELIQANVALAVALGWTNIRPGFSEPQGLAPDAIWGNNMAQQWTEWTSNPFHAIKKCVDANQIPEDWEKVKTSLVDSMSTWAQIDPATYLDDVLQEVAEATGIVVQYEDVGLNTRYKASYDE